jgi:hypothetical protein
MTWNRFTQTSPNCPAPDLKGAFHASIHGLASRAMARADVGLSRSFQKAQTTLPLGVK